VKIYQPPGVPENAESLKKAASIKVPDTEQKKRKEKKGGKRGGRQIPHSSPKESGIKGKNVHKKKKKKKRQEKKRGEGGGCSGGHYITKPEKKGG